MAVFPVLAAPLWYLLVVSFYRTPSRGLRGIFLPWLAGLLVGIATLSVTLSFLTRTPFGMKLDELYPWAWIRGSGWPLLLGSIVVTSVYYFKPTAYSRIRELAGWFSGIGTVHLAWTAFVLDPGFEATRLFLAPVVWLAAMGGAVFFLDRALRLDSWSRHLFFVLGTALSSLLTFLPILQVIDQGLAAWIIAVFLALAGTAAVYFDSRGRFD